MSRFKRKAGSVGGATDGMSVRSDKSKRSVLPNKQGNRAERRAADDAEKKAKKADKKKK